MKFIQGKQKYSTVSQRLQDVLNLVYAKRPLLEYEVVDVVGLTNDASTVKVWQHGQLLGVIKAHFRRYSPAKQQNDLLYSVYSPFIEKKRGSKNTKICQSAEAAAKAAITFFAKQPLAVLGEKLADAVLYKVGNCHDSVRMALMDSSRFSNFEVVSYFLETDAGNNPETPKTVKAFLNDTTRKKYEDFKIGTNVTKHAESKNGYAIAYMKDESLLVVDLKNYQATQKYASTYEMPQFMQEKFTILKLLEARQFAENIGIKVCIDTDDSDLGEMQYFIVAGETVVN